MKSEKMPYIINADVNIILNILQQQKQVNILFVDIHYHTGKYRGLAHSICNLKFSVSIEIPVAFHNGSNYDFRFIIKKLTNEFDGQFECFGENCEKHKNIWSCAN